MCVRKSSLCLFLSRLFQALKALEPPRGGARAGRLWRHVRCAPLFGIESLWKFSLVQSLLVFSFIY